MSIYFFVGGGGAKSMTKLDWGMVGLDSMDSPMTPIRGIYVYMYFFGSASAILNNSNFADTIGMHGVCAVSMRCLTQP